jgi:hypothetical protein
MVHIPLPMVSFRVGVVACALLVLSSGQNMRGGRRKKRRDVSRPQVNTAGSIASADGRLMRALTINYPLHIFDSKNPVDWRAPATYSAQLVSSSEAEKSWTEVSQAQDQEDVWLYENYFYGMANGVVMESGALNGILFSNSFMFEHFANWTAIHVEADPENYNNLKVNRERAINVHGALCSESRLLHYSSLGVVPVRGFVEFMTPSFLKKWHGKIYNNKTRIEDLPTVQCLPVKLLLRQLNVHHIDLWILDLEGAEESALRGTDFNEVHFNVVAMECDDHDISKNQRKTDILEANGFKCTLVERNCMCRHKTFRPSASAQKSELKMWDGQKWAKKYVPPAPA